MSGSSLLLASRRLSTVRAGNTVSPAIALCRTLTSDGYLHKTAIPTYHFQDSLPKLPIPKLEDTLKRYISSATPLRTSEELERTKAIVEDFGAGQGQALHQELVAQNKKRYSSYISEPWYEMYLKSRAPLPINFNPQLTMKDDDDPAKHDQAARTAVLIRNSVDFYRTLRDQQLKPDIYFTKSKWKNNPTFEKILKMTPRPVAWYAGFAFGAFALDMSQYASLFRTTRLPEQDMDRLITFDEAQARHVVIQYGNDFFKVDVLNEDGTAVPLDQIHANILGIMKNAPRLDGPAFGLATSLDRNEWAALRKTVMEADAANAASINTIDTALFAVCLEHERPGPEPLTHLLDTTNDQWIELTRCMLHGTGRNRWFDKSFQLIVADNAKAAINFEHSWGDGVAVLRYFEEVYFESLKTAAPTGTSPAAVETSPAISNGHYGPSQTPQKLQWKLPSTVETRLAKAGDEYDAIMESLEKKILQTPLVNTGILKELGLAGDGTMQMAFQLGHYIMHGHNASTYESAATAGFKHGRTETIRSCTPESDAFVRAFTTKGVSLEERNKLMRKAIKNHGDLAKNCLLGKGWDRHLFALKHLAEKKGMQVPALYTDETYQKLSKIIMSTSTLSSPALDAGGFGPVNEDCYGIGYGVVDIGARMMVMSYHRGTQQFLDSIEKALLQMLNVARGKNHE